MISKNLNKIKQLARKDFLINFFSLTVFQLIELFIPLLSIPIIINRVGSEKFGLLSFALVFSLFFQLIINFGFNAIAIRDISININDSSKISKIFNDVNTTKLILSLITFSLFLAIVFFFNKFNSTPKVFIYTFLSLVIQAIMPIWFFQGIQESKYLILSNFIGKIFYLLLIIIFIKNSSDYLLVPIFNALGFSISTFILFYIIIKKYNIKPNLVGYQCFKDQINIGKYMFLSEVKLYFVSSFNVFLLGLLSGNLAVAYFVGADKILRAITNLFVPIQNSLFPILANKLKNDKENAIKIVKKIVVISTISLTVFCFLLLLFSNKIIVLILGYKMQESTKIFNILAFLPLLSFLDTFFGKQILLNLNKEKYFFRVVVIIAIINFPIVFFCSKYYSYIGASYAQLFIQLLLTLGMYYYANKQMKFFTNDR